MPAFVIEEEVGVMPYKDPARQKAASRRSYERNKAAIQERQRARREQPGFRELEYEKRRLKPKAERQPKAERREPKPKFNPTPEREAVEPPERPQPVSRPRRVGREEQALIDAQRQMKEAALKRLGLLPPTGGEAA